MTNLAYSSSTSSYLISKAAFKLNDFQKVFNEFDTYEKDLNLLDYKLNYGKSYNRRLY